MVLAWDVMLPLGILAARLLKIPRPKLWPGQLDSKLWWRSHIVLQCSGVIVMTAGVSMVLGHGYSETLLVSLHRCAGWCLVFAGWLQIFGGLLRGTKGGPTAARLRGDHYDMTRRRVIFEYVHKLVGWLTITLILVATTIGLFIVDAPRWMWITLAIWWIGLIAGFLGLQRAGCCFDTYEAIWGPNPVHPGNARVPIGWGVRRIGHTACISSREAHHGSHPAGMQDE